MFPVSFISDSVTLGQSMAQTHYNRVIADGGVLPSGISGLGSVLDSVITAYGVTDSADFNTKVPVFLDPHYTGYKLGAGSGTTLGQAAQKVYSMKDTENLVLYSEQFSNGNWEKQAGISITSNYGIAPDGTNTSSLMVASSANGIYQSFTGLGGNYTNSIYIKGTIGTTGSLSNGQNNTGKNDFTCNGTWQRITCTYPASGPFYLYLFNLSANIEIWGAQINTGSVALPYTATTTTTETLADVTQTTAASQPLLLAHSGDNYLFCPRVDGNNCTTPVTGNSITGNLELISCINSKGTDNDRSIIGEGTNAIGYNFSLNNTNNLYLYLDSPYNSTATIASGQLWVRVTYIGSTGNITFYTSTDPITTAPLSVNWTQLGTVVNGPVNYTGTSGSNTITVGKYSAFPGNSFNGYIYRVTKANSIGGAPVVDFNPATYNAATSQTAWTSATDEVWTINTGTAATGYKGVVVSKTIIQSDGIDDRMTSGTLTSRQYFTRYFAFQQLSGATEYIIDGNISDRHLIYSSDPDTYFYNGSTGAGQIVINTNTRLNKLLTGDYNSTNSKARINAGSDVSGSTGQGTSTGITLFSSGGSSLFANVIINTVIDLSVLATDLQKTATYNITRSMNNNAF